MGVGEAVVVPHEGDDVLVSPHEAMTSIASSIASTVRITSTSAE
jgi:hypothetical protein